MPDLTLDQVRDAGRFAWHPLEYLFVPDVGLLGVVDEYDCDEQQGWEEVKREQPGTFYERSYANGWHHLPRCDCEFCHE